MQKEHYSEKLDKLYKEAKYRIADEGLLKYQPQIVSSYGTEPIKDEREKRKAVTTAMIRYEKAWNEYIDWVKNLIDDAKRKKYYRKGLSPSQMFDQGSILRRVDYWYTVLYHAQNGKKVV